MQTLAYQWEAVVNTIRYADDKAVVANSQKGLQQPMKFGMKINVKKTKMQSSVCHSSS